MTGSDPQQPQSHGAEYPPPEGASGQTDPHAPVDYPADAGLPPAAYPPLAPGYAAPYPPSYPPPMPGYYPGTGYAYDPYWPARPLGTNGKAIGSLVSSVIGLTCCGLTSIVGVILGVIAMRETKRTGQEGWGIALAGTIIGGLALAALLVYLLLYVGLIASGWQWT